MRYYIKSNPSGDTQNYTHSVLENTAPQFGHEVVRHPGNADAILVSLCDITEIDMLEKIRNRWPEQKIIAGGPLASAYFKLCAIFADYVNVGQCFDFFEAQSFEEIEELPSTYLAGKEKVKACTRIDWEKVPIAQVSKGSFYYWGGVGCKNKCRFCLTSWTNPWQRNSPARIKKAASQIPRGDLKIVSNQYNDAYEKVMVKDMLLREYINGPAQTSGRYVRMGVEFATEETRKKYGKPCTHEELLQALAKAERENTHLILFFIGGINTRDEWIDLFQRMPQNYSTSPRIFCKFTNLEYQMHTPIFKERYDLDPERYLDGGFGRALFRKVQQFNNRIRIKTIKYPAHAVWRMGQSLCTTLDNYHVWQNVKDHKDIYALKSLLHDTGVIETDYSDMVDYGLGEGGL